MCEQFMGSSSSLQVSYSIVEDASYRISCETTQSKRHRCFLVIHIATPCSNTIMEKLKQTHWYHPSSLA